jgi:hypothetical protein
LITEVGHHGADPRDGDVRVEAEHVVEEAEHADLHQRQRDPDVEEHPHDAARVPVEDPREEVRPRQRARVGVRDVDLHLREHHEEDGEADDDRARQERVEAADVLLDRLARGDEVDPQPGDVEGQERARELLEGAEDHPARPGRHEPRSTSARRWRTSWPA